jgi:hypothetical protein
MEIYYYSWRFIKKYIDTLEDFDVVYGGRLHPEKCPSNHQKLRWKKFIMTNLQKNRKKTVSIATFQQYRNQKKRF